MGIGVCIALMSVRHFSPGAYEENENFDYNDQIDREPGYDVLRPPRGKQKLSSNERYFNTYSPY